MVDHQDGEYVIASKFTHDQLLPLLQATNTVRSRRHSILLALLIQLECLLDPNESNEPYDDATSAMALEVLTRFARENWPEILRIHHEMGLGWDFDTFVVPHVTGEPQSGTYEVVSLVVLTSGRPWWKFW